MSDAVKMALIIAIVIVFAAWLMIYFPPLSAPGHSYR